MNIYDWIRPWLFRLTGEQAHSLTVQMLRLGGNVPPGPQVLNAVFQTKHPGPAVQAFGLTFKNPLGMAAGYDKDGLAWRGLACLGFGHIELGTVTPRPQPGNPKPRIFRLVEDEGLINRMGFPSKGAGYLAYQMPLANRPPGLILGVNLGKNKATPLEEAAQDYVSLFKDFAPLSDYLAVNVSSPNTPGLRLLQSRSALEGLLRPLAEIRASFKIRCGRHVPILVKLAPDLDLAGLDAAIEAVESCGMDGLIISNTSLRREDLQSPHAAQEGGLSGRPLSKLSLELVQQTIRRTRLPVVASGGVMTPDDVKARMDAGAVLVQLYTGLIYEGPWLVRDILDTLNAEEKRTLKKAEPALQPE